MARMFRWYQKKRGNRRTGSQTLGSVGEAILFAVLLLIGSVVLTSLLFTFVIPEWRVNNEFVEHTCKVVGKRLAETEGEDGPLYRPEFQIEYVVGGVQYSTWTYTINNPYSSGRESKQAVLTRFSTGKTVTCWYDPLDPQRVVLECGYSWWIYLAIFIPVVFILIGAGGLLYTLLNWGKSAERRAAATQRGQEGELPDGPIGAVEEEYPHVPQRVDITSSPGTKLLYRLPIETSPGWALLGTLLVCLIWNGIVAFPVYYAVRGHVAGKPEWILTIFIVPFVLIGVFLFLFFFRQLLLTAGIGPTLLEITDHPLYPAGEYKVFLSQSGRLAIKSLSLSLVCHEEATYQQGTNTRTETRQVYCRELLRRENFQVPPGIPFETDCTFTVPVGVMHSFRSAHNKIDWKLVVEGDVAGWPNFKRSFSVVIYPARGRSAA